MLVDKQRLIYQHYVDAECSLKDLPGAMDDRNGWRESQGTPRYKHDLYIYIYIYMGGIQKS